MKTLLSNHVDKRTKRFYKYLICSLLAHIIICLVLFILEHDQKSSSKLVPLFEKAQKTHSESAIFFQDAPQELPASLKPRKSHFGVPDGISAAQMPLSFEQEAPIQQQDALEQVVQGQGQEEQQQAQMQQQQVEQPEQKQSNVISKVAEIGSEQQQELTEISKQIQAIEQQEKRFNEIASYKPHDENVSLLKKQSAPAQQKTAATGKKNIIAMTKGFIENFTNEGNDWMKRDGDDSKRPSMEEMKFFSYEQRISWQMQASWKQHFERSLQVPGLEGRAVIAFILDAQGNVVESSLLESSGYKVLDNVILQNVKLASPFPPVPKHFNMPVYRVGRIIRVSADRFRL